jgi:oligopeptidase B
VAERIEHLTTVHHLKDWSDPYFYLRDKENEKTIVYLKAENEYTEAQMASTVDLQAQLFKEMRGRIRETDCTVPYRRGEWYYYTRTLEGQQYSIHCRKKDDPDIGREEILVDVNALAAGKPFLTLGILEVSPDGNWLAYSVDESGDEDFEIFFKDLRTGKLLDRTITGTEYGFEWSNDNKTVYYTKIDDTHRPYQVWKHEIGQTSDSDVLIFEESDQRFYVSLDKSRDGKFIFIHCDATLTSEVRFLDANEPSKAKLQIFSTRRQGVEYQVTHHNNQWVIITNADSAKNFKLLTVRVSEWVLDDFSSWKEILPHRTDVKLDRVDCFDRYMAIWEREKGYTKLRVKNLLTNHTSSVEFPEAIYTVSRSHNYESEATVLRISYSSLVTPKTIIDYNMMDATRIIRKEEQVNGYDKSKYETAREFATAKDGTQIPISIIHKKGLEKNGQNPTVLYGYGSYGVSIDPYFDQKVISLVDRGVVYAIAHIRGGGENGRAWYEGGKLMTKKNTFEDFIESARHLIARKYTSPNYLGIWGASAGGLLMGAVTNMAPELFRAVIADVPFVDVMNTMLDPTLPLVVNEYEEWGNPNIKADFDYMLSYAPYENIQPKAYPAILAIGGMNDPRVPFWEPAKWVAKLRLANTNSNVILLRTEMDQGHGGASGRFDSLKEEALRYAFLLSQLGANKL